MSSKNLLKHFSYTDLPEHQHDVAEDFCYLAEVLVEELPESAEKTIALRKLIESRDAALRAVEEE